MTDTAKTFEREIIALPPEDYAFLAGMAQAITAMYCRLHPVQEEPATDNKKEGAENC